MDDRWIIWLGSHVCNFFFGLLTAFVGYFTEIKEVIHVMLIVIFVDLVIGLIAARCQGEGIKSYKLWRTVYKTLFAVIVVSLLYSIDKTMGIVNTHVFAAWVITGFEMWSILESMGKITNHKLFRLLKVLMEDKIKDTTGVDITKDYKQ